VTALARRGLSFLLACGTGLLLLALFFQRRGDDAGRLLELLGASITSLARELDRNPDLLLVGQPTRGVDIGAIEFIHRRLVALRDAGRGLLVVSVELDEILALADRILVMHDGHILGDVAREDATEQRLGLMMAGVPAATLAR